MDQGLMMTSRVMDIIDIKACNQNEMTTDVTLSNLLIPYRALIERQHSLEVQKDLVSII